MHQRKRGQDLEALRARIVELCKKGEENWQIAERLGVSKNYVSTIRVAAGLRTRLAKKGTVLNSPSPSPAQQEEVPQLPAQRLPALA